MSNIELQSHTLRFGSRPLFQDLSCSFQWSDGGDDRIVGLMGPSGSGKTTLLRQIVQARYENTPKAIRINPSNAVIGFVPQQPIMFSHLDVMSNARLFERIGRYSDRFSSPLFERVAATLGIERILRLKNHLTLSGGEIQRIMLLRTLAVSPDILLLDEPAVGLDPTVREEFLIDLAVLVAEMRISAIYVGHHWDEIAFVATRIGYTVTDTTDDGSLFVTALPITTTDEFRARPPTIGAFQTVYGPGCATVPVRKSGESFVSEIWDASTPLVACLPPSLNARATDFQSRRPFRIRRYPDASHSSRNEAWIYRNDRFESKAILTGNPP